MIILYESGVKKCYKIENKSTKHSKKYIPGDT